MKEIKAEEAAYVPLPQFYTFKSVSYTHLDVYKRQHRGIGREHEHLCAVRPKGDGFAYGGSGL